MVKKRAETTVKIPLEDALNKITTALEKAPDPPKPLEKELGKALGEELTRIFNEEDSFQEMEAAGYGALVPLLSGMSASRPAFREYVYSGDYLEGYTTADIRDATDSYIASAKATVETFRKLPYFYKDAIDWECAEYQVTGFTIPALLELTIRAVEAERERRAPKPTGGDPKLRANKRWCARVAYSLIDKFLTKAPLAASAHFLEITASLYEHRFGSPIGDDHKRVEIVVDGFRRACAAVQEEMTRLYKQESK